MPYATAIIKLQLYFVVFTCELVTPEKKKYLGLSEVHGFFCRRRGVVALTGATCENLRRPQVEACVLAFLRKRGN